MASQSNNFNTMFYSSQITARQNDGSGATTTTLPGSTPFQWKNNNAYAISELSALGGVESSIKILTGYSTIKYQSSYNPSSAVTYTDKYFKSNNTNPVYVLAGYNPSFKKCILDTRHGGGGSGIYTITRTNSSLVVSKERKKEKYEYDLFTKTYQAIDFYDHTIPSRLFFVIQGAGGGGAGSKKGSWLFNTKYNGGAGGAGATAAGIVQFSASESTITIIVGSGGAGATTWTAGGGGGNSSITSGTSTVTAGGGGGGQAKDHKTTTDVWSLIGSNGLYSKNDPNGLFIDVPGQSGSFGGLSHVGSTSYTIYSAYGGETKTFESNKTSSPTPDGTIMVNPDGSLTDDGTSCLWNSWNGFCGQNSPLGIGGCFINNLGYTATGGWGAGGAGMPGSLATIFEEFAGEAGGAGACLIYY